MIPARLALLIALAAFPASAQDFASGDAIRAAIPGNTVQGSMTASGTYAEYYATNGEIRGADYTGAWAVEGDRMCFDYGDDPATCWNVRISGNSVTWVTGTTEEGNGTILPGNPNNY